MVMTADSKPLPTFDTVRYQNERAKMLIELLQKGSVGAEIGVFRGDFSATIIRAIEPSILYLVDPWDLMFGERYQDWGGYTEGGSLLTSRAIAEVKSKTESKLTTQVIIKKDFSTAWLESLPDGSLDWAYIDASHAYDATLAELRLCKEKVKKDGIICGHDYQIKRDHPHHGVFRAVQTFVSETGYEIIWAGPELQWALRSPR